VPPSPQGIEISGRKSPRNHRGGPNGIRTRVSNQNLRFVASSDSLLDRPGYPSAVFFRFQRAKAALRALSRRSSPDIRRARARPPFFPSATARESLRRFIAPKLAQGPIFDLLSLDVDIMRSATHTRAQDSRAHISMSERVSKQVGFKGLDALVQCLQRYVAENPLRFDVREESDVRGRVLTIVLNTEDRG